MILTSYWLWKYASRKKLKRFEVVKPIVALGLGLVALFINEVEIIRSYYELTYVSGVSIQNTFLEKYQERANIEKSIFIFSPGCIDCQKTTKSINKVLKENSSIKLSKETVRESIEVSSTSVVESIVVVVVVVVV